MRGPLWRALAVVVVTLVVCTTSALTADKPPIKIGLLYSLSGMAAVVTEGTVYAHEIAAEEINAKGGYVSTYLLAEAIERAGSTDTEALVKALRGGTFRTLLGDVTSRDFDGQATFGYYTGFPYTNQNYSFKRLKNVIRGA